MSEAAHIVKQQLPTTAETHAALSKVGLFALVLALVAAPLVANSYLLYAIALCFANSIAILSVSVLVRYGGEISIGHSVFVGLGAYAVAIVERHLHVSLILGLPVALATGVLAGLAFAYPSRRVTGIYLAVLTMALALSLQEALLQATSVTGGFEGLYVSLDLLPGAPKTLQRYYVALAVLALACLLLARFRGSSYGLALLAARSHPRAAEAFGVTRSWSRLSVFAISGGLAAIGGAVFAFASSTVSPNSFTLWSGIFLLVGSVVSLHGLSLPAALFGGAFLTLIPEYLAGAGDWVPVLYGVALLVIVLGVNRGSDLRRLIGLGRRAS